MEEQDLPIEINAGKLLDWLIDRRHCTKGWKADIHTIRTKINNAIQDMPVHEGIAKLLSGTHINYFHCKKIIEILKETEADSKNLFGRYGSQRMKDWQEIVRLYEKDNLYLAEAAQMLMRNVTFEVPSCKKEIQKFEQVDNEMEKKEAEYKKSENIARTEFNTACKQLGISGNQIKRELAERIVELPAIYEAVAKKAKGLEKAVEFYRAFVEFTLEQSPVGDSVPMVKYLIDKGNTTTYEWTYGKAPLNIVEPPLSKTVDDDIRDEPSDETNLESMVNLEAEIDLGDGGGDIDGGIETVEDIDYGEIDFNITLEESGIVVESAGDNEGTATGNEALTILDNPDTRDELIYQLFELEAFLKLRLHEYESDSSENLLSMSQMQQASPILQLATQESTQSMLNNVQVVLTEMLDSRVEQLHNIKHSPRYVDVLTGTLQQKLSLIDKMVALQNDIKDKRAKSREEAQTIPPLLKRIIERTRELQGEIEKDISKKYNNRVVRLTGGVNAL